MHRTGGYRYYDGGTFQALELPYKGDDLSMVVLLPKDPAGLPALEQSFTAAASNDWMQKLQFADKVILTLPRFTMTQQFELSNALSAMGMPQAFSGSADFSGMTGKPRLHHLRGDSQGVRRRERNGHRSRGGHVDHHACDCDAPACPNPRPSSSAPTIPSCS